MLRVYNFLNYILQALMAALGAIAGYQLAGWIGVVIGAIMGFVLAVNLVYLVRGLYLLARRRATSTQNLAEIIYPTLVLNHPGIMTMLPTTIPLTELQGALNQAAMNDAMQRQAEKADVINIKVYPLHWTFLVRLLMGRRVLGINKTP